MTIKRQILLCRLGFVLSCLLPTLLVGLWIVSRSEGGSGISISKTVLEQELTNQLGLVVEIDHASGQASAFRLNNVRLRDPETNVIVAEAAAVEAICSDTGWQIEAVQPQVDATHLRRLAPRLHDRLLCAPTMQIHPIAIIARDLILTTGEQRHSVAQVTARLASHATGPEIAAEFQLSTMSAEPFRLTIARNQQTRAPSTDWQLATGAQLLPTSALAEILPEVARLGRECRFAGTISAGDMESGWSGELSGTLTNVDFDTLVTEHLPHQLSGIGTIRIERATVASGRLTDFRGTLEIGAGSIGGSLLAAAEEHLKLQPAGQSPVSDLATVAFQRLALGVELDGRMLRIHGLAGQEHDGTVIADQTGPLLIAGPGHAVPAVNLLRALLPDSQFQVPATRQTDALVGLFPVPDLVPTRTASRHSHVPTRLRSSGPAAAAPVLRQPGLR